MHVMIASLRNGLASHRAMTRAAQPRTMRALFATVVATGFLGLAALSGNSTPAAADFNGPVTSATSGFSAFSAGETRRLRQARVAGFRARRSGLRSRRGARVRGFVRRSYGANGLSRRDLNSPFRATQR